MFRWIPYVFVRITIVLMSGILLGVYFPDLITIRSGIVMLVGLFVLFSVFVFVIKTGKVAPGVIGLTIFFLIGYINVQVCDESKASDHLSTVSAPIQFYQATITSFPEERERSWRSIAEVSKVKTDAGWENVTGKIQLYFDRSDTELRFQYGDVLLIKSYPKVIPSPRNPNEFDYKRFLSYKNINHQDFIRQNKVHFIGNYPPFIFLQWAMKVRRAAHESIKKYVNGEQEQAIVSALVLGITDGLDNELLGAYSASGAMHVLAVSGLHVGIIYWIVLFLLRPIKRIRGGRWMIAFVSVGILWCYVFITGMSPSVLRAATMFSFVALAEPWHQRTNIYNTLAASAFCLLLFDPFLIMSVGFQLSYLAVLGIVYLYPQMREWWRPSSWLLDQCWKITAVSIAAQLSTFSLGLLYFHQFPVYFLFSNLFVIPLSFAVLVLGIGLVTVSFFATLSIVVGTALTLIVTVLNKGIFLTESLPFSLIQDVHITTFQCWLLIAFLITILLMIRWRNFGLIYISTVIILVFSGVQWYGDRAIDHDNRFTVYSINGHYAMELFKNKESYFFSDSSLLTDSDGMRFHLAGNRVRHAIRNIHPGDAQHFVRNLMGCRIMMLGRYSFLHIYDQQFTLPSKVAFDYVIVSGNSIQNLDDIKKRVEFRSIVFDGTNSIYPTANMIEQAKGELFSVHSVLHHGALEIEI